MATHSTADEILDALLRLHDDMDKAAATQDDYIAALNRHTAALDRHTAVLTLESKPTPILQVNHRQALRQYLNSTEATMLSKAGRLDLATVAAACKVPNERGYYKTIGTALRKAGYSKATVDGRQVYVLFTVNP